MLIGQDPYIHKNPNRVKYVLMLDEEKSQLKRWLRKLLGEDIFKRAEVYATNVVKCQVEREPSISLKSVLNLLTPYFENCRGYLISEITQYEPKLVLTFGDPAHRLFTSILSNKEGVRNSMQDAFNGGFIQTRIGDTKFLYSPCLHIKTFRVAETYGNKVNKFKSNLDKTLTDLGDD